MTLMLASIAFSTPVADDLIILYPMNEVSGPSLQNEYGPNGTMQSESDFNRVEEGFRNYEAGNYNINCNMDATSDYIETGLTGFGGNNLATFCLDMRVNSVDAFASFVTQSLTGQAVRTFMLNMFNDGFVKMKIDDTWYTVFADTVDIHHHVCMMQNGTDWYFYDNGTISWIETKATTQNGNIWLFNDEYSSNGCVSGAQTIDNFLVKNSTSTDAEVLEIFNCNGNFACIIAIGAAAADPPNIDDSTWNLTNTNCENWQTDKAEPCYTTDSTPTVKFDTNVNADCAIGLDDGNYTNQTLGVASRNCTTTGATSHVCTVIAGDALSAGTDNLYIGCRRADDGNQNLTSTSGALVVNMAYLMEGTVKDENAVAVGNASVQIIHMANLTRAFTNITTDETGAWSQFVFNITGGYVVWAFDQNNISRGPAIHINITVP